MELVQGQRLLLKVPKQDEWELRPEGCPGAGLTAEVGVEGQFGELDSRQHLNSGSCDDFW